MNPAGEPGLLRPLSLGEIFDRALTLYVRNFVPFTMIALVIVVPLMVVEYFAGRGESSSFAQLLSQIQNPKTPVPAADTSAQTAWLMLTIGAAFLLNGFAAVAIAAAVRRLYSGEQPDWRACYTVALRRAGGILVTLLSEAATFMVVVFAGAFAMGAAFFIAFLLVRSSAALGVIAFAAAALVVVLWILGIVLCYLAYAFALSALGVEETSAGSAIGAGFSRIFNRGEMLRASLLSLALIVVYLGFSVLSISMAAVLELMKLHLIYIVAGGILSLVVTALLGVLLVVYYFDVRVRREGLDVQAQMDALAPVASAP